MARPQKEGLDYFPHDTDAVNDEKLEALRALYGNDGYAFFFILLERIYRSPNAEIDVSDAETLQILARKVSVTQQLFSEMMQTALKWGCFDKNSYEKRGVLTSNGVKKRALPVIEKRANMRLRYEGADAPIRTKRVAGQFCIVCGFEETVDLHHSTDGKVYPLCPNHHAIVSRKLDTFENLIEKSEFVKKQGGLQKVYQRLQEVPDAETKNKPDKVKNSKVKNSTVYIVLFDLWNKLKIITHKKLTPDMKRAIDSVRKDYSQEEVGQAMRNYSIIVNGAEYYFKHRWTLAEFLSRRHSNNVERFLDLEVAKSNFQTKDKGGQGGRPKTGKGHDRTIRDRKTYTSPESWGESEGAGK